MVVGIYAPLVRSDRVEIMGAKREWNFEPYPMSGSFAEDRWEAFKHNPEWIRTHYGEKIYQDYLRRLTAEDVIDEMMEAYWREQADRLDPDAGALLHRALDIFAESWIARLSSEGDARETP